jgi:hypothetical protein
MKDGFRAIGRIGLLCVIMLVSSFNTEAQTDFSRSVGKVIVGCDQLTVKGTFHVVDTLGGELICLSSAHVFALEKHWFLLQYGVFSSEDTVFVRLVANGVQVARINLADLQKKTLRNEEEDLFFFAIPKELLPQWRPLALVSAYAPADTQAIAAIAVRDAAVTQLWSLAAAESPNPRRSATWEIQWRQGDSGSPIITKNGDYVGIVTSGQVDFGLGYYTPAYEVEKYLALFKKQLQEVDD